jgi:RNA polymerase sigma-70 factor, ECF subfamily
MAAMQPFPLAHEPGMSAAGNPLDAWVLRHQGPTWRFLRLCGCPADLADDLLQDAMFAAVHKRIHERPEGEASAWLRGAASNLWRMHLRTQRRRPNLDGDLGLAELAFQQCGEDDSWQAWLDALRNCLLVLDGRARSVLQLRYTENASRERIAHELGLHGDGVKTLLRRVRDLLRQCVLRRIAPDKVSPETSTQRNPRAES